MIQIDVLFFEGCPNHEPTVRLVRETVEASGVEADVRQVEIANAEIGRAHV